MARHHESKAKKLYKEAARHDRMADREGRQSHMMSKEYNHRPDRFNDEHHKDKDMHRLMERANYRMLGAEYYAGMDPRRRQELEDAGMLHEDHNQVANLPQQVIMKPYPKVGGYSPEDLNDTEEGIRKQLDYDNSHKLNHLYPKKV